VREKILLVGNSANHNRGCEAIARGTLATFNEITGGEAALSSGVIVHSDVAERYVTSHPQHPDEPEQFALRPRLADDIGSRALAFGLGRRRRYRFGGLDRQLAGATRMLEVGGDNYSLDYGRPYLFIDLDREIQKTGRPLAIWGASVGPFSDDPGFEAEMTRHLSVISHIYVRESLSFDYLTGLGLTNVTLAADPAIVMPPSEPATPGYDTAKFKGAIGLNFSPFQARQLSKSGRAYWETTREELEHLSAFAVEIVRWTLANDDRPVLLVPHVMPPEAWNNDHQLLTAAYKRLEPRLQERVAVLPPTLTAPEIKWAIAQCSVFAGSRTHSTLAAISSSVPTLSFGYSRKATGLMRDLYGHGEMCVEGSELSVASVVAALKRLFEAELSLRPVLSERVDDWRQKVLQAGRHFLSLS
jgi:polysaccharide pyruvyl transferase WcaK-like protein